jgi:hypothetical protein
MNFNIYNAQDPDMIESSDLLIVDEADAVVSSIPVSFSISNELCGLYNAISAKKTIWATATSEVLYPYLTEVLFTPGAVGKILFKSQAAIS